MTIQQDFLGIQDLEELSSSKSVELHQALEDLLSPLVEIRDRGLTRLCEMDAHRRSPLAACFLVYRLIEADMALRTKIVCAICKVIKGRNSGERSPTKVQEYVHQTLRGIGDREILALLELIREDENLLAPVCDLLNQCSTSGERMVKILNSPEYPIPIRMASCKAIGQIGFIEARQAVETLERRLTERTIGQLSMAFAHRPQEETKDLIPILRRTLDALQEASI